MQCNAIRFPGFHMFQGNRSLLARVRVHLFVIAHTDTVL